MIEEYLRQALRERDQTCFAAPKRLEPGHHPTGSSRPAAHPSRAATHALACSANGLILLKNSRFRLSGYFRSISCATHTPHLISQPVKRRSMPLHGLCSSIGEPASADANRPPQAVPQIRIRTRATSPRTGLVAGLCFPKDNRIEMYHHPRAGTRLVSSGIACTDKSRDEVVSPQCQLIVSMVGVRV